MPPLKNQRHELFAQGLAKGLSAAEAYKSAGYKGDRTAASRLSSNINVQARVAELQQRAAIRTEITIEKLTAMLVEDRDLARELGQSGPAVSATEKLGKLHGFFVERQEVEQTTRVISAEPLSEDEWIATHRVGPAAGSAEKPH